MKEQRCLYCERPLALFSRLTGDGEFCSKEHRRIYQKEHSQLALARLLQAQPSAPNAPSNRRLGDKSEPSSPGRDASTADAEISLAQPSAIIVEQFEQKPRSKDPENAGFRQLPEFQARVSIAQPRGEPEARWNDLPLLKARRLQCFPCFVNFVAPGAFLRRQPQPAAPSAYPGALKRGGVASAAFNSVPTQMRFFDERLRRTERIGFCPP